MRTYAAKYKRYKKLEKPMKNVLKVCNCQEKVQNQ